MAEINNRNKNAKKLILSSYLSLLDKDRNASITVKDICQNTIINRGTFYLHYSSMEDYLVSLEENCYEVIEKVMNEIYAMANFSSRPLFDMIEDNPDLFKYFVFYSRGTAKVKWVNNMRTNIREKSYKWKDISDEQLDLMVNFLIGGAITYFIHFINHGLQNKQYLIESMDAIVTKGTRGLNQLI